MLETVRNHAVKAWRFWLSRRSHKGGLSWEKYEKIISDFPLPLPRIIHNIMKSLRGSKSYASDGVVPVWLLSGSKLSVPRNRMREIFTSGSVGRTSGNRCLYPEADGGGGFSVGVVR
ncbi:MAG: hypothetical protein DRI57_30165 [Deltaproteobacteria bacterium]|nr:MAG: hypothetical protein DRI57_30165 [Deltaproteobacteria bacterium]